MGGFLQLLRGDSGPSGDPAVREHLKRLARSREAIEIEPLQVSASVGRQFSIVERLENNGVVIGRPSGPGAHRPLIQFGAYTLLLPSPDGELAGESKVLARVGIRAGAGNKLHCYRMSIPTALHAVDRQKSQRLLFGGDLVVEARVRAGGRAAPLFGSLEELTPTSARVRCRAAVPIVRGAAIHLDAMLPEPVGELMVVGEVVGIEPGSKPEDQDRPAVHIKFLEPVDAIKRAIANGLDQRRAA